MPAPLRLARVLRDVRYLTQSPGKLEIRQGQYLRSARQLGTMDNYCGVDMKAIWRTADAVCFDVDSTVCRDEGIDELADFLGVGEKVANITNQAMGGSMTFQESLNLRLSIIRPTEKDIDEFIAENPPNLTEGIRELVALLVRRNVHVYLVSGGFRSIIEPVARELHIPNDRIYANRLLFEQNGDYSGFDTLEPTSRSGGKARVIEKLKDQHGYKRLVMIGDGATDMEASPPADAFIGFGGNQRRDAVKNGSKWFVTSFHELINCLQS